ncbi:MAG: S41 family peptidase [Rhabdochlamydiaceae bacterium]|nr:S41 family peptidase [Rhabdochlamydiaceae bacterium]
MRRRIFFFLLVCIPCLCFAKPPSLTPQDTKNKIQEILKSHVSYQKLSEEIIQRSFIHYLDEIDPSKTYFLESEVAEWITPSEELLKQTLQNVQKADFSNFLTLHSCIERAVARRNQIELEVASMQMPTQVSLSEFKDLTWVKTEEDLKNRILRIKALQLETAEKLSLSDQEQFTLKLKKRRINREEELLGKSATEKTQTALSYTLKSISSSLDSQTAYFTPSEATQFMIQVQQKLYGIGAQLKDDLNGLTIVRLLDGGPAGADNKLKVGDKIIAVDKEPIVGMEISDAVELIRGQQGTPVRLTVLRTGNDTETKEEEKLEIEIIRGEVVLKESRLETSKHPFGDGCIGILHLFSFYQDSTSSSAKDLAQAINELKKDNKLKGIILDLRNNAGGVLTQAVAVTGLFIDKGVVVSVKDNTNSIQRLRNLEEKKAWDGPLLVLTNRGSASASEIVAQTLQEYGRAFVIGDSETFGKGTFQTFTLESANYGKVNPKGEFKVTRGRYYTVSGKSPQLVGVIADIVVPGGLSQLEVGEKHAKFPVSTDEISSSIEDDFSDLSPLHRLQLQNLYAASKQTYISTYTPYLEMLKANSKERIDSDKNYQNFLKELEKKDEKKDYSETFGQSDLQLTEAIHVMSDLIFLLSISS